jgi:hypothetical protein
MLVPEGYRSLHLMEKDGGWIARLVPEGYVNEWSRERPIMARARTADEAYAAAVAKCRLSELRS